jgi:hypothetical protein
MLTDTAVRNAKPKEKLYKLTDGKGLYLLVNQAGKYWCIYFATFTGKPRCGLAAQLASIILEEKIADDYVKKI